MADDDRLDRLEKKLEAALVELERLKAIEAIRDCIYRVCRGTDRVDADLVRSAYHPGAQVHYGKMFDGPFEDSLEGGMRHQAAQSQRQHLVGNITIRIDGNTAVAESYELDRHKTPMGGEIRDLILAARTLDRFEKRDGEWKIVDRTKVMDWGRTINADDGLYQNSPLATGSNDRSDPSYQILP